MLIPQKVNVVFDPLSSGIGAGRLELLGIEDKQRISLVKNILSSATEFIATTILTAGIGAVFQTTKAVAETVEGFATLATLSTTKETIALVGSKFTEAAITSAKFAVSSTLVQTTSGAIQGESAEDIIKEVSISAAVITGISFAQATVKAGKLWTALKKTEKLRFKATETSYELTRKWLDVFEFGEIGNYRKAAQEIEEEFIKSVTKIKLKAESSIIEDIIGTTIGKELKGIDSLQSLALSKLKLSALRKLLKKGAKGNARINKLYQATNRIAKKQKALENKIRKTIKDKIKPITDIFNIDNVKKQFNNHFDSQTKEYNDLISRSRKDISAIEKLKLSQDMDKFYFRIPRSHAH